MSNYIINFTDPLKGNFLIRPYTSNGPKFPTTSVLNDTSIAGNSTLLLYGKGHPNYGERTDENLLNLLENFSGATEPVIKVAGMLWHKEVLYYRDSGGATFYVYGSGSPGWTAITLFGTGAVPDPVTQPTLVDGDYWYDNGSPEVLYQYSSDERGIDGWIVRIFDQAAGVPSGAPLKEVQIYDGDAWDILPDLTAVTALITALGSQYLRLDTTNDPLTGNLEISKEDPTLTLTASGSPAGTPTVLLSGDGATVEINGADPELDLVGSDPTVRFRGGQNWQVAGNDSSQTLEFRIGSSLGANVHFEIDNANDYLTHGNARTAAQYRTDITAGPDNTIPNKLYVDGLVSGAITGDIFINAGSVSIIGSPATGTLTMPYSNTGSPGPSGDLIVPGFDSDNIPFVSKTLATDVSGGDAATVDAALKKAAPINSPTFVGNVNVPGISVSNGPTEAANKSYVDQQVAGVTALVGAVNTALRDVQVGGSTTFSTPFAYTAGNNRLMVFKNGVKQYKDELASSTATFSPALESDQILTGLPVYDIVGVSPHPGGSPTGTNTWTIDGDHAAEFVAGDTFDVFGNGFAGANITYTVVSATAVGSPALTDIVVAGGSPVGIPSDATASGTLGINYEFRLTLDGTTSTIAPVNLISVGNTVNDLITQMQAAADAVVGAGEVAFYLYDGDIRVDSLRSLSGSPVPTISMLDGVTPTTALFDTTNLGVDGFASLVDAGSAVWAYFESNGAGGNASSGSAAASIEFNTTTLVTDIIEFLVV